jgi:hypothetical protein
MPCDPTADKEKEMSTFRFADVPSNDSVASLVTFLVSAWFLAAGGAMLAEPSVDSQARAIQAKTPTVTVRQISVSEAVQPDARFTINVVAQRLAKVS